MRVPRRNRRWVWAGRITAVLVLAGLTSYLARAGLDTADKLASSIGVVSAVAALLAPYLLPAPQPVPPQGTAAREASEQTVTGSGVGGDVRQISGVAGGVRIGPAPTGQPLTAPVPPSPPAAVPSAAPAAAGSQVAGNSTVTGSVTQIGDVGGDVDIDR
jgi:hypothetical protein